MKTCKRLVDFVQIINAEGEVRTCSWTRNSLIGNIHENDLETILNDTVIKDKRKKIANGDFSECPADNCPYQANCNMEDILIEYDDDAIVQPESIYLAYEGNCNYHCTCCTSLQHMLDTKCHDYTKEYEDIDEKLKKVINNAKHISANGRGELFCSPHILKILSEWKPVAPAADCSVILETNGSLFNEVNWRKIENLGRYHLEVTITVMSFQEDVYQFLSGTKLPVSNIIENLKFVKKLRDKGIVNSFKIATVMQELNFREMPEFTKRCLDEFGVDVVRIRPIFPGGMFDAKTQWFMDVRNSLHPYNELYRKIMSNPIFKDERVLLWSNDLPSDRGDCPDSNQALKERNVNRVAKALLDKSNEICRKLNSFNEPITIFGLGFLGKILVEVIKEKVQINCIIDNYIDINDYNNIRVETVNDNLERKGIVIITPIGRFNELNDVLNKSGFEGRAISLKELLEI